MSPDQAMPQFHLLASGRRQPSVRDGGQRVTVIGRRPGCEVRLDGHSVSELHAALVRRRDGVWLFDLGSRNGTRVNGHRVTGHRVTGHRVTGHRVADGDHLQFGDSRYRIHISGPAGPPAGLVGATLRNAATDRSEPLVKPVTVVGRRDQSDLHLSSDQISRVHALLARCGDGLVVHDLGSRSGTFVNDRQQRETLMTGGETLAFGPFRFQVEIAPEAESPQPDAAGPSGTEDFLAQVLGESEGPAENPADDFLADMLAPPQEQPPDAAAAAETPPPAVDADEKTGPEDHQASAPPGPQREPQNEPQNEPQDDFEAAIAGALAAAAAGGATTEEPFEDLSAAIEPMPLASPPEDETKEQEPATPGPEERSEQEPPEESAPEKQATDSADTGRNGPRKHG